MNSMSWLGLASAAGAVALVIGVGCGGNVVVGSGGAGTTASQTSSGTIGGTTTASYDACNVPADCAWGEIKQEILSSSDCPCLYGCPYLALSKATVDRRNAQYKSLCTPGMNGSGEGCGIDDCAIPPSLKCSGGKCTASGE